MKKKKIVLPILFIIVLVLIAIYIIYTASPKELKTSLLTDNSNFNSNKDETLKRFNELQDKVYNNISNEGKDFNDLSIVYDYSKDAKIYGKAIELTHKENGIDVFITIAVLENNKLANNFFKQKLIPREKGYTYAFDVNEKDYKAFYINKYNSNTYTKDNYCIAYVKDNVVIYLNYTGKENNGVNEKNKNIILNSFEKIKIML